MKKSRFAVKSLAFTALTSFVVSAAQAQSRTWVSGTGNDADPCSREAPCKTFAGAISKTATGGQINVLDPGGYGALTITKAITIEGNGIIAGNLSSGISGFTINITTNLPSDKVVIRNVEINGNNATGGFHGIRFLDGTELTIENVHIKNFTGSGISVSTAQSSTTNIKNVTTDNLAAAGVSVNPTGSGEALVLVVDSRLRASTEGVVAGSNSRVLVRDSVIGKVTTGLRTTGGNSIIHADDVAVTFCQTGIQASTGSSVNVTDSVIAQNALGLSPNGGEVNSFGGNSLMKNAANGSFTTSTLKQ
jgi:hypothetical protein